ncbi:centromere protein C [Pezoporus flaviventris]|uniref:centromere protein C n=1 Tax=Pezoporus flaviventris TaxID=889875 RepID=UPI002AAFB991|nr:centromere protein C [Pezoporus flaviventris]
MKMAVVVLVRACAKINRPHWLSAAADQWDRGKGGRGRCSLSARSCRGLKAVATGVWVCMCEGGGSVGTRRQAPRLRCLRRRRRRGSLGRRMPGRRAVENCYKREYRARFCRGRGNKIAVEPGQNILKLIQDGFEGCGNDLTITSSSPAHCSTPVTRNDNTATGSTGDLTNSVERAFNSAMSLPASPLKPVNNRAGCSHESPLKPVICDCVADSKTPESPVPKEKTNDTLKDVEALHKSPDMSLDPEDGHGPIRLLLLEEAKGPPVHTLHFHGQNAPAAVKSHMEVENLGGLQTGRDEQVVLMNGTECTATSSVQKRKSFSSVVLAAVATETLGKRYSASISPPSPPPVKDQDIENECDFFIDESYDVSCNSFFSIPRTNKKSRKASSATPVSKFQPSEKMTESKKSKNRKAQVEALTKQTMDDLNVRIHQLKRTSESDSISDSEGKVLKSQRQNITRMEKEKTEGKKGKKRKVQVEALTKQKMDVLDVRMHELKGTSESNSLSDSEGKVLKSQRQNITHTEKEKAEGKKGKKRKVQVQARTKQKMDDLDVRMHELEGTSESDSISDSEGRVLKSQRQNITHMGKTKKDALKQSSPNKEKDTPWKPEAKKIMLSQSGLETKACDAEQCKTMVMPSEDSLMSSAGHQQEQSPSPKENLKSSRNPRSASKASQHLVHKKQSVKQKHPGGTVAKRLAGSPRKKLKKNGKKSSDKKPQLQRKEISHSVPSEEELESEPAKLDEVFASVLYQELETSVVQNLAKSEKPKNVLQTLESIGGANYKTPVKALQHVIGSVKNSEKKLLSAESSGKIPKRSHCRSSEGVCSGPEDDESQMDSDSCSVQESTRENRKLSDVKIKRNKRKRYTQHGLKDSIAALKPTCHESRPVLEHCDKFASRSQSYEQDDTSSDNSEGLDSKIHHLLSDKLARHKIVMPSNTPNVRRTKRLRLRPLEYWRGERVNYTMRPSGGLVISGIVCPEPEPEPHRKIKLRKDGHKQRKDETRSEIPPNLDHSLADTSKPTAVVDPVTNEEVLLECVNTESSNACFFKDESVEIYKNLNTSAFATGKLILKPFKEKGHQFVHMDTIAFHIICGKVLVTLHKTSYYLTTGDFFYVPAGNGYNIRNLLNKESVLLFTQLKKDRPNPHSMLET